MCSDEYILSTARAGYEHSTLLDEKKIENMTPIGQVLGETSFMADSPSLHLMCNGRNNNDQRKYKN